MKSYLIVVFVALIAYAFAAAPYDAQILRSESDISPEHYSFSVETSDGKSHQEAGALKDVGSEHPAINVHGSYTYKDEYDGQIYTVNYVADEHGYHPEGAHIPQLPKIVV